MGEGERYMWGVKFGKEKGFKGYCKFVAKKTPISVYETFWKGRGWTIEGGISKCFTEWKWLKSSHRENNIYVILSWRHQLTVEDPLGQSHHTRLINKITSWWTPHKGLYLLDILYIVFLSTSSIVQTLKVTLCQGHTLNLTLEI